ETHEWIARPSRHLLSFLQCDAAHSERGITRVRGKGRSAVVSLPAKPAGRGHRFARFDEGNAWECNLQRHSSRGLQRKVWLRCGGRRLLRRKDSAKQQPSQANKTFPAAPS